ncbi:MAG: Ig-like domain-containing domain [Bacteroidetes bacterium]|nr:Ig-like domain-containing domain [Bacteroidota bacterium]
MRIAILFLSVLLLAGCAQVGTLSGGEKDIVPPKLVKSFPQNEATNFNQTKIELIFNEFVQLSNIQQQLIISPPVNTFPKVAVKGKRVILTFDTLFRENTTYSLFFGDGIADFTERNPWAESTIVFSTGSRLDFLQLSGKVENTFDGQAEAGMFVMLYPNGQKDSVVAKALPSYFGKTDKEGKYIIKNIHEGEYRAFALKDINSNYLFDQPNEKIAYHSEPIKIYDSISHLDLGAFVQDYKRQFLSTKKVVNEREIVLAFNKKNKSAKVEIENEKGKINSIERFLGGDSLVLWLNPGLSDKDSIVVKVSDKDFSDTLTFFLKDAGSLKALPLKVVKDPTLSAIVPGDSLYLSFNFPLQSVNSSLISITQDSITKTFSCQLSGDRKLGFKVSAVPAKSCKIKFAPGAVTDIYGRSNKDTLNSFFTLADESAFGILALKLEIKEAPATPFVLQLMSGQEVIKEEKFTSPKMQFNYKNFPPGEYKIKLIFDGNGNGRWESGNYYLKEQPEKIIFYEKALTVRANWEMEIEWIVLPE